ncbi:hypothetical protein K469DRAFT_335612 [Zopfia rhizophila CBS 207.26]|uniref:Uncharacterized protein n=1 Tax=Zopfia rhizophila CBS 207.26 TaxID=1314779 RepID=A0A6A6DFT0_9PEZI|nr:hypothetical protein K469DRAFT_335612 [Zopfia rhizophila CBS 207.26]
MPTKDTCCNMAAVTNLHFRRNNKALSLFLLAPFPSSMQVHLECIFGSKLIITSYNRVFSPLFRRHCRSSDDRSRVFSGELFQIFHSIPYMAWTNSFARNRKGGHVIAVLTISYRHNHTSRNIGDHRSNAPLVHVSNQVPQSSEKGRFWGPQRS